MTIDQPVHTIQAHTAKIYALTFSPDGTTLTSSGEDCRVQNWDVATGAHLYDFAENNTEADEMFGWSRIFIKKMMYVTEDQLIGYGSWSRVVNWDVPSGETNYMIEPDPLEYYNGMITLDSHFPEFLEFNPENQNFVINYVEYDLDTGEQLGQYQPPDNFAEDCATVGPITADGKLMFSKGYDTREGEICILDTTDQHLVQTMEVTPKIASNYDSISWMYLSPDGSQLLVSLYSGILQVYQIKK
jgi:WD40 repeat protein